MSEGPDVRGHSLKRDEDFHFLRKRKPGEAPTAYLSNNPFSSIPLRTLRAFSIIERRLTPIRSMRQCRKHFQKIWDSPFSKENDFPEPSVFERDFRGVASMKGQEIVMYRTAPLPLISQIAGAFHPDPSGTIRVPVNVSLPRTSDGLNQLSPPLESTVLTGNTVASFCRLVEGLRGLVTPTSGSKGLSLRNFERKRVVGIEPTGNEILVRVSAISRSARIQQTMLLDDEGDHVHGVEWSFERSAGHLFGTTILRCSDPYGPIPLSERMRSGLFDSLMQFIANDDPAPQRFEDSKENPRRNDKKADSPVERSLDEVFLFYVADPDDVF